MSSDILETLKANRSRATVQQRQDPLLEQLQATPESETSSESEANVVPLQVTQVSPVAESRLNRDDYPGPLRRLTLRLTEGIGMKLDLLCSQHKLTPETLIEALISHHESTPGLMEPIIDDAKSRYALRKKVGVRKRAIAMQKYQ